MVQPLHLSIGHQTRRYEMSKPKAIVTRRWPEANEERLREEKPYKSALLVEFEVDISIVKPATSTVQFSQ